MAALSQRVPAALRGALGPRWDIAVEGNRLTANHSNRLTTFSPPRQLLTWTELLGVLEDSFAGAGIRRDSCLPLRWGRETELTVSAVQALDPHLKDGEQRTYRSGFLPQPVVRLTGRRDERGELRDGFLTSFVNVSYVQPIQSIDEFAAVIDIWLSVLSCLGLNARQISLYGSLAIWRRREVEGVTLRFRHLDHTLGDINLLWNVDRPEHLAVDLGSGLERLAWARARCRWDELIYGPFAHVAPPRTLDAIRTATLLLGHGIAPAARGAGGITRRIISSIAPDAVQLGVDAAVRYAYRYWALLSPLRVEWPAIATMIENECHPSKESAEAPVSELDLRYPDQDGQ